MDTVSFVDECTIHVRGGDGGNGAVSFRREAHVPRGGPDGGDGGAGGDVVLVADENTSSLLDLHRSPHRRGADGGHGSGQRRAGAHGADTVVYVPVGTVVRSRMTGEILADLAAHGQRAVVAQGGRGGRGNAAFATRHRRVPRFAEVGERVEEHALRLELKLIADVGLVGFPSAGKSSLVRRLSSATPRVESWPFTTLTPHLGVMRGGDTDAGDPVDVVLADVPGLIEGAADGRGLGSRFLRHIERCMVVLHVLDAAPFDPERDPISDLAALRAELHRHDPDLLARPQLAVLNKTDLPDGQATVELYGEQLRADDRLGEVVEVSAVTGAGLERLRYALSEVVAAERARLGAVRTEAPADDEVVLRLAPRSSQVTIDRDDHGRYHVHGDRVERWVQMLPLDAPDAVRYLQGRLRRAGVEQALVRAGARAGDEVVIGTAVFDFAPDPQDLPADEREALLAAELARESQGDARGPESRDAEVADDDHLDDLGEDLVVVDALLGPDDEVEP